MAQSTNDTFPTAIKVCAILKSKPLIEALQRLVDELEKKAEEYKEVLKMGRTHLQDAVPITLGQEMALTLPVFAVALNVFSLPLKVLML